MQDGAALVPLVGQAKEEAEEPSMPRWPTIFELRGLYLDADALAAGAKESEMYSDEALRESEQLRSSPEVRTPTIIARSARSAPHTHLHSGSARRVIRHIGAGGA